MSRWATTSCTKNRQLPTCSYLLGNHVADTSIWSAVVTMLATLEFDLAQDAKGNDISFEATFTSGGTEYVSTASDFSSFCRLFLIRIQTP